MNNIHILTPGTTYETSTSIKVTPVKVLLGNRAIFVTDAFYPTPFAAWDYDVLDDDNHKISLYNGEYYESLDKALQAESDRPGIKRLYASFYCPSCEVKHYHTFSCTNGVQKLVEHIEDVRAGCPYCGHFMDISSCTIADDDTEYTLPIWTGPTPTDA